MIQDLVRKHLRSFAPYTSARSEIQKADILLDANELSLGTPVSWNGVPLNRYPDPNQLELRTKLAMNLGVRPEQVFVGSGSDEIIDLLIRLFCEPGKEHVAVLEPTYGVYRVAAAISGVAATSIQLDGQFQIDLKATRASLNPSTKIVFVCSPNNPTGNLLNREDIFTLCRSTNGIVVVDQAYLEFADSTGDMTLDIENYDNLVVLRTLSKAWGLAGIRLGYCTANPLIVSYLLRIKSPYNINAVTSRLASDAIGKSDFLTSSREQVRRERKWLGEQLKLLPFVVRVYPSEANFILAEFSDSVRVYEQLLKRGIVVRRRSETRLKQCLRITVGTHRENESVLRTLKECE